MEEDLNNVKTQEVNENQKDKKGKHAQVGSKKIKEQKKSKSKNVEEKKEKENKKNENTEDINKKVSKILVGIIIFLAVFTFVLDIYYIYTKLIPKFKNVQLEIGYEKELTLKDFITNEKYLEDSKVLTDLNTIDLNKVRRI